MNKPTPEIVEQLDYKECAEYIKHKYGSDIDDFWASLCDNYPPHNGSYIWLWENPEMTDENKDTLKNFLEEFGEGPYWVAW